MQNSKALSSYYIFNMVAKTGNFSHAAEILGISQPAVSRAIKKLEQELKITLYTRESHGIVLTKEGFNLFERSKSAFEMLNIDKNGSTGAFIPSDSFVIGITDALCKAVLSSYINSYIQDEKECIPKIEHFTEDTFLHAMDLGKCDLCFVKETNIDPSFIFVPIAEIQEKCTIKNIGIKSDIQNIEINSARIGFVLKRSTLRRNNIAGLIDHCKKIKTQGCVK